MLLDRLSNTCGEEGQPGVNHTQRYVTILEKRDHLAIRKKLE